MRRDTAFSKRHEHARCGGRPYYGNPFLLFTGYRLIVGFTSRIVSASVCELRWWQQWEQRYERAKGRTNCNARGVAGNLQRPACEGRLRFGRMDLRWATERM